MLLLYNLLWTCIFWCVNIGNVGRLALSLSLNSQSLSVSVKAKGLNKETGVTIAPSSYILQPNNPEVFNLPSDGYLTFSTVGISETAQFVIMQVHTQHTSLTLTSLTGSPGIHISGNSIGMVTMLNKTGTDLLTWNLTVTKDSVVAEEEVAVLVVLHQQQENAPIPGGCNQVFQLETDPNILVRSKDYKTQVWFQWARVGGKRGGGPFGCENKDSNSRLKYDVYVQYVSENDDSTAALFDVVLSMSSVEGLRSTSQLISSITNDGTAKSLLTVTSQSRQGAVYGVVVKDGLVGTEVSYVSAITYACNHTAGQCSLGYSGIEWALFVLCGSVGLFLLLLGHSWFKTEMSVFGCVASALVIYILFSMNAGLTDEANLGLSCATGLFGGVAWFFVWKLLTFPSISVILPGLCAGYLVAAVFFFTPFANITWWGSAMNYGLIFTCITLLFTVCLLCNPRLLNIVSCGLVGAYCVTVATAIFLRSSLLLIVLNVIHHSHVPGYASVTVIAPFQINDIILSCLWFGLLVSGVSWQYYHNWGKPHFPNRPDRHTDQQCSRRAYSRIVDGTLPLPVSAASLDENTPLLIHQELPPRYEESLNYEPTLVHQHRNASGNLNATLRASEEYQPI